MALEVIAPKAVVDKLFSELVFSCPSCDELKAAAFVLDRAPACALVNPAIAVEESA
jgi:hypothetical protein